MQKSLRTSVESLKAKMDLEHVDMDRLENLYMVGRRTDIHPPGQKWDNKAVTFETWLVSAKPKLHKSVYVVAYDTHA